MEEWFAGTNIGFAEEMHRDLVTSTTVLVVARRLKKKKRRCPTKEIPLECARCGLLQQSW